MCPLVKSGGELDEAEISPAALTFFDKEGTEFRGYVFSRTYHDLVKHRSRMAWVRIFFERNVYVHDVKTLESLVKAREGWLFSYAQRSEWIWD